jgi:hypothetical protein
MTQDGGHAGNTGSRPSVLPPRGDAAAPLPKGTVDGSAGQRGAASWGSNGADGGPGDVGSRLLARLGTAPLEAVPTFTHTSRPGLGQSGDGAAAAAVSGDAPVPTDAALEKASQGLLEPVTSPGLGGEALAPCPADLIASYSPWDPALAEAALLQFLDSVKELNGRAGLSPAWVLPLTLAPVAGVAFSAWARGRRAGGDPGAAGRLGLGSLRNPFLSPEVS